MEAVLAFEIVLLLNKLAATKTHGSCKPKVLLVIRVAIEIDELSSLLVFKHASCMILRVKRLQVFGSFSSQLSFDKKRIHLKILLTSYLVMVLHPMLVEVQAAGIACVFHEMGKYVSFRSS